ncbi:MAG: hypothetical protein ACYS1A_18125 [Planctomycetota bacterium]|jgi:hypothetical protein
MKEQNQKNIDYANSLPNLGPVNIAVFPSVLAKLRAWEKLVTALSYEALESEGVLPEGATREEIKQAQANIEAAYFGSIETLLSDYLEKISRRDFIRKSLELGLRDRFGKE